MGSLKQHLDITLGLKGTTTGEAARRRCSGDGVIASMTVMKDRPILCDYCARARPNIDPFSGQLVVTDQTPRACDAFPDGIPDDILNNTADHRNPVDGDRDLRFDPKPLAGQADTLDWLFAQPARL